MITAMSTNLLLTLLLLGLGLTRAYAAGATERG